MNNFINFLKDRRSDEDVRIVREEVGVIVLKNLFDKKLRHRYHQIDYNVKLGGGH